MLHLLAASSVFIVSEGEVKCNGRRLYVTPVGKVVLSVMSET